MNLSIVKLPFVTEPQSADYRLGALLLINKPKGWTSFDVVNKIRGLLRHHYQIKNIKVGHSGTLDPMATGLLLICTGAWTKELHHLTGLDKTYTARITLGIATDTYDAEGATTDEQPVPALDLMDIQKKLQPFTGTFLQHPPAYSAIKKEGKPLYELARAGKEVKTEPRQVTVFDLQIIQYAAPHLDILIHCGSGFYVRSLAHDLGQSLGCGAHLSALTRNTVGPYSLEDALDIQYWVQAMRGSDKSA